MLAAPALWPWSPAAPPADGGGDAAAGAPAAAAEQSGGGDGSGGRWPADPSSLLGRRVLRTFEGLRGKFDGVVRSTRLLLPEGPTGPAQQVWGIAYADGDAEELYWHELLPYLVRLSDDKSAAHTVTRTGAAVAAPPRKRVRPRRPPPKYKWDAEGGGAGSGGAAAAAPHGAPAARPHGAEARLVGGVVVKLPPRAAGEPEVHGSSQSARAKHGDAHRRQGAPTQAHAAGRSAAGGKAHGAAVAAPAPPRSSSAAGACSLGGPHAAAGDSPPPKRPAVKLESPPPPEREDTPCPSADGSEPPVAPAPAAQQQLVAAPPDGAAAVQEFLRQITPTIKDLDRVVAAVPPRMTIALLLRAVAKGTLPADREASVNCFASFLGIDDASDRLQLLIELQALARRVGS